MRANLTSNDLVLGHNKKFALATSETLKKRWRCNFRCLWIDCTQITRMTRSPFRDQLRNSFASRVSIKKGVHWYSSYIIFSRKPNFQKVVGISALLKVVPRLDRVALTYKRFSLYSYSFSLRLILSRIYSVTSACTYTGRRFRAWASNIKQRFTGCVASATNNYN